MNSFFKNINENYNTICFNYEMQGFVNHTAINKIVNRYDYIITNEKPHIVNKLKSALNDLGKIILIANDIDIQRYDYVIEKKDEYYLLSQTNKIFSKTYSLTTNSYDVNDNMTMPAILDLIQDCAGLHAEKLGVGYHDFVEKNFAWILMRTKVELTRPITENQIVVRTWQSNEGRVDFNRDLVLETINGEVLGYAVTKWCVIDYLSRRIIPSSKLGTNNTFYQLQNLDPFLKIADSVTTNNHNIFKVLPLMMDHNGHMNNTKYAEMIMNSLPLGINIEKFEINYIHEAVYGDIIDLYWQNENLEYLFEGKLNDSTSVKAKVKIWKE